MNRTLMEVIAYISFYLSYGLHKDMEERGDPNPDETMFGEMFDLLRKLTPQERQEFAGYLDELAAAERKKRYRGSVADFFSTFADSIRNV